MKIKVRHIVKKTTSSIIPSCVYSTVLKQLCFFALSFIFAQGKVVLLYSIFCPAFLAFVPYPTLLFCLLGGILGYFVQGFTTYNLKYITILIAIACLRWIFSELKKIKSSTIFLVLSVFIPLTVASILLDYIFAKLTLINILIAFCEGSFCGCLAYFFKEGYNIFTQNKIKNIFIVLKGNTIATATILINICCLIISLTSFNYIDINLGEITVIFLIMIISTTKTISYPVISAIVFTIALTLSNSSLFFLAIPYSFSAIVVGLFSRFNKIVIAITFLFVTTTTTILIGYSNIIQTTIAQTVIAIFIFMIIPTSNLFASFKSAQINSDFNSSNSSLENQKLQLVSNTIFEISSLITQTNHTLNKNCQTKNETTWQLGILANILNDLSKTSTTYKRDSKKEELLTETFKNLFVTTLNLEAQQNSNNISTVEFTTHDCEKLLENKNAISSIISEVLKKDVSSPCITKVNGLCKYTISQATPITCDVAVFQHTCVGNTLCGDNYSYFNNGRGEMIFILSDGMGCGGRAAVESTMVTGIMASLIKSGISFDNSLKILNSAIIARSCDEIVSTLDIVKVNLFNGKCEFMKCGAAKSYLRQNNHILNIDLLSPPLGILQEANFNKKSLILKKHDTIVIISDGAFLSDDSTIEDIINSGTNAKEITNKLKDVVLTSNNSIHDDDITIITIVLV